MGHRSIGNFMTEAVTTAWQSRRPILFVNHSMAMGGIETLIVDLIRRLPRNELEPHVAVFESGGSLETVLVDMCIPIHHIRKRDGVDLRVVMDLRRILNNFDIETVHSHNFSTWLYAALAVHSLPWKRIIHVHTEHSDVAYTRRRYLIERLLGWVTTYTVAVSEHVRSIMINKIGIAGDRVRKVYNGIDAERFAPDASIRYRVRAMLGIGEQDVVVGIVARLSKVKDHTTLLHAFAQITREPALSTRLLIVGEGPERPRIEQIIRNLGLGDCVMLLGERQDIADILNAVDIYALSSLSEGMNLTLLEAMGCGLPVVATSVGGNTETVVENMTGFLTPPQDAVALSSALKRLVTSDSLRQRLGHQGRERILQVFNQSAMVKAYLSLYRRKQQ